MGLRKKWVPPPPRQYAPLGGMFGTFWLDDVKKISFNMAPTLLHDAGRKKSPFTLHKWETGETLMGDTTRPQQDPKPGKTSVTDLVLSDIKERREQGIAKYGTELKTQNGRKALVDLYQELLDAVMYVRQRIEEERETNTIKSADMKDVTLEQMELFVDIGPMETGTVGAPLNVKNLYTRPGRFIPVYPEQPVESIAQEAHRLVLGDRGQAYGHPIFDMTRSADMLTSLLRDKLKVGVRLEAEDIGQAMICVKQSRHRNAPKRDNLTDTAGYSLTLQLIQEWREAHPGADPRDHFPAS